MRVRAYAFQQGEPPREVQLWNPGDNSTDYGVHKWTAGSVEKVLADYSSRGNPLLVDIEHNCSDGAEAEGGITPTAGYARLEVRGGAPWLVFDWSAIGVDQIRTRQRLFLSPDYAVDTATGEIVGLTRVSLVAEPGTHNARMLASSKKVRAEKGNGPMDLNMVLAALRAALAAEDPQVAKDAIAALVAELSKAPGDAPAEDPAPEQASADDKPADDVAAAADAPADDDKKKEAPVAAKIAAAKKADPALVAIKKEIDGMRRDQLLKEKGHRLQESQRVLCAKLPYAVVNAFIEASADTLDSSVPAATARVIQGKRETNQREGLAPAEITKLRASMGLAGRTPRGPEVDEQGDLRIYATRPSDAKAIAANIEKARAALKGEVE